MPIRVQIVDSQRVVRRGLSMLFLTDSDITLVAEAADGQEAIEVARQQQPDLILMDILLPKVSGAAVIGTLREQQPQLRIVALSSSSDYALIGRAILAGADTYLHKGNQPRQLIHIIKGVAAGRVILPPALRQRVLPELPPPTPAQPLTGLDLSILKLLAATRSDIEIAEALQTSIDEVQSAVRHVQEQLSASTRLLAVLRAMQLGLIAPETSG
ncbi:MAG: hypothetical protein CL610_06895 [Anaerolineaceae bacterium]|nr:hypothetical protein [Anaerolineaceae bacterium]